MLSDRFKYDGKECEKLNKSQYKAKNEIIKKINNKTYIFENISCPICECVETQEVSQKDKYGIPHQIGLCKKCGFLFATKRLTNACYTDFYINNFNDLDIGYSIGLDKSFNDQYNNANNNIYPFLKENIELAKSLNILEIGCSSGGALQYFKEKKHNVIGLDLGVDAINYGKSQSLELYNIDLPDFKTEIKFDLVIYNSVLEHIVDLESHFVKLQEILKDDGYIFVRVPGIKNLHNNSFHKFDLLNFITLPHIYYFSVKTLTNLMSKYKFKHIKSNEVIFALFQKDRNTKIELKNDYEDVLKYIKDSDNILKIRIKNILFYSKLIIKSVLNSLGLLNIIKKILGK